MKLILRLQFLSRCDKNRWLAKQWDNVCTEEVTKDLNKTQNSFGNSFENEIAKMYSKEFEEIHSKLNKPRFSANSFLKSMIDEKRHGNDRYIKKIWNRFHPGEVQSLKNEVKNIFPIILMFKFYFSYK